MVIYIHGGLYLDIKSAALNDIPISLLSNNMLYVSSSTNVRCKPYHFNEFLNWFILAPPQNIAVHWAIKSIVNNILKGCTLPRRNSIFDLETSIKWKIIYTTGPRATTIAFLHAPLKIKKYIKNVAGNKWDYALENRLIYALKCHETIEGKSHYTFHKDGFYTPEFIKSQHDNRTAVILK